MRWILPILCLLPLCACGPTRAQRQQFSQALANIEAARLVAAAAGDHHGVSLCIAAAARIHAALGNDEVEALPPPETPAAALSASSGAANDEEAKAKGAKKNPPPGWGAWWLGVAGSAGLLAVALGKELLPKVPVIGPLYHAANDLVWTIMATKNQRAADRAQAQAARVIAHVAPIAAATLEAAPDLHTDARIVLAQVAAAAHPKAQP
jgi:hypothetical protein